MTASRPPCPSFRPKSFEKVTSQMLSHLEGKGLETGQKLTLISLAKGLPIDEGVPWGGSEKMVNDILHIINDKRVRDGRPLIDENGLRESVRLMMLGKRKSPAVEELSDALCNLREIRLGTRQLPPLDEGIKRTA